MYVHRARPRGKVLILNWPWSKRDDPSWTNIPVRNLKWVFRPHTITTVKGKWKRWEKWDFDFIFQWSKWNLIHKKEHKGHLVTGTFYGFYIPDITHSQMWKNYTIFPFLTRTPIWNLKTKQNKTKKKKKRPSESIDHVQFLLRGHNWVHFAHGLLVYCYTEFKLRYLKNLNFFSIRVKELFKPKFLRKKGDGFLLFLKA